jgi:hypothetical protein
VFLWAHSSHKHFSPSFSHGCILFICYATILLTQFRKQSALVAVWSLGIWIYLILFDIFELCDLPKLRYNWNEHNMIGIHYSSKGDDNWLPSCFIPSLLLLSLGMPLKSYTNHFVCSCVDTVCTKCEYIWLNKVKIVFKKIVFVTMKFFQMSLFHKKFDW